MMTVTVEINGETTTRLHITNVTRHNQLDRRIHLYDVRTEGASMAFARLHHLHEQGANVLASQALVVAEATFRSTKTAT